MNDLDAEWLRYLVDQSRPQFRKLSTEPPIHSPVPPTRAPGPGSPIKTAKISLSTLQEEPPCNAADLESHSPEVWVDADADADHDENVGTGATMGKVNPDMELTISTKTKVLFLNQPIDIHALFWDIPLIDYWSPQPGVLKKQIKVVSNTPEEFAAYQAKLTNVRYYKENVIKQINNPTARNVKFKDERKITVGLSKKDIVSYRGKVKNAFYNCFALIIRFHDTETCAEGVYREIHIKVFNTGKMEIPGIVHYSILEKIKYMILDILQPHVVVSDTAGKLAFIENSHKDHVLINSNFNCGFFVNRERLHGIISGKKYEIESSYDPCSYPGVKCKFYYNHAIGFDKERQNGRILEEDRKLKMSELTESKKYTEVSFMIFRTGSGLIVGNCTERVLRFTFEFIKNILIAEYEQICITSENPVMKNKRPRLRKRVISYTTAYHEQQMASAQA
jgi:hypothetical protein